MTAETSKDIPLDDKAAEELARKEELHGAGTPLGDARDDIFAKTLAWLPLVIAKILALVLLVIFIGTALLYATAFTVSLLVLVFVTACIRWNSKRNEIREKYLLDRNDFINLDAFFHRIKNEDHPLSDQLRLVTAKRIRAPFPSQHGTGAPPESGTAFGAVDKIGFLGILNEGMLSEKLFKEEHFPHSDRHPSKELRNFVEREIGGVELIRCNRLLLEFFFEEVFCSREQTPISLIFSRGMTTPVAVNNEPVSVVNRHIQEMGTLSAVNSEFKDLLKQMEHYAQEMATPSTVNSECSELLKKMKYYTQAKHPESAPYESLKRSFEELCIDRKSMEWELSHSRLWRLRNTIHSLDGVGSALINLRSKTNNQKDLSDVGINLETLSDELWECSQDLHQALTQDIQRTIRGDERAEISEKEEGKIAREFSERLLGVPQTKVYTNLRRLQQILGVYLSAQSDGENSTFGLLYGASQEFRDHFKYFVDDLKRIGIYMSAVTFLQPEEAIKDVRGEFSDFHEDQDGSPLIRRSENFWRVVKGKLRMAEGVGTRYLIDISIWGYRCPEYSDLNRATTGWLHNLD